MSEPKNPDRTAGLPQAPPDDWGRFVRAEPFGRGDVWFRPRHLAEHHAEIEHLSPRVAVDLIVRLIADGQRATVESIHRRAVRVHCRWP